VMRFAYALRPPDLLEELAVRHDLAGVADERRQEAVFDRRELDFLIVDKDAAVGEIDAQVMNREDRLAAVAAAHSMTEGDPDAREQFAHAERLGEVVVGAGVEGGHLVAFLPPR